MTQLLPARIAIFTGAVVVCRLLSLRQGYDWPIPILLGCLIPAGLAQQLSARPTRC